VRNTIALTSLLLLASCTHVQSSGLITHPEARPSAPAATASTTSPAPAAGAAADAVAQTPVSATRVPEGAQEIGILEAHGRRPIARLDER
jgi:hypothetical protein